jgi:uncharacterized protein YyaL (SSP411 family)
MKPLNEIPDVWRLAIQRERGAYDFYARMAQAAGDAATRALFEMLRGQEKQHHDLLEAEYRRLFEPDLELGRERLPIKWYEWEDDSFRLADELDLPVMLYITAPWCEPCHLMERTTFADPEVVEAINADVIPIMVDADKRPDVDARYNKGGWPTTAFLNAVGDLLESHNYLTAAQLLAASRRIKARYEDGTAPAEEPMVGVRPGQRLAEVELYESATDVPPPLGGDLHELPERILHTALAAYDRENGGLGGAPKFHHADVLEFFLAVAHRTGDEALADTVHRSLTAMAGGGLYDPVDGGFFRYATAADWSAPHYEKMAGDQAQLLALYLIAYQATGQQAYLGTARGVLRYVDTVLWDRDQGYFYSSQAADPDYYRPGLDAKGRASRPMPYVDKTAYTERNAAVASAYMVASSVLNEPRYADLAIRALEFVWLKSYQEGLGMHHYFDTQCHLPGMLADQVTMAQAWLDAFEHYGREIYLQRAETLMRFVHNALRDQDGRYFDSVAVPEAVGRLRRRGKPFCENVLAAEVDLRLHRLTGREEYRQSAQQTLQALIPFHADLGLDAARFALAVDRFLRRPLIVTVVGENEDPQRAELLRAARRAYASNKTIQAVDPVWEPNRLARLGYPARPAPAAYVCLGTLCARPTADPNELLAQAEAMVGQERTGRGGRQYKGYTIDEGLKPEPQQRLQYFFRVLKDGERVFRYCIWSTEEEVKKRWPDLDLGTEAGRTALRQRLSAEGYRRVQAKIDAGDLANWLLDLRATGEEEVVLEDKDE